MEAGTPVKCKKGKNNPAVHITLLAAIRRIYREWRWVGVARDGGRDGWGRRGGGGGGGGWKRK